MMTLVEMKAAAYDTLAQIEHLQNQLVRINQAIAQALQTQQENVEAAKADEVVAE